MSFFQTQRRKLIGWLRKRSQGDKKDVGSALKSVAYAYGFYYGGWLLLVLAGLAVLSFTSWLGGPYVVAQVIFFLIVGTVSLILLHLFVFYRTLKGKWDDLKNQQQYREARDVSETTNGSDGIREGHVIESTNKDDR